ncbi:hypothetical protein HDU76_004130 [Blyttiomyces sp. JEL0837]|nr:hypothetical protein HDU76_004130 [Blyttiomyces sp. JEL0837]
MPKLFGRVWLMQEGVELHERVVAGDREALLDLFTAFKWARIHNPLMLGLSGLLVEAKMPEGLFDLAMIYHIAKYGILAIAYGCDYAKKGFERIKENAVEEVGNIVKKLGKKNDDGGVDRDSS